MSISDICNKQIRVARLSGYYCVELNDYCNNYAQKVTGNTSFKFESLPDSITKSVIYGLGKGEGNQVSWATFLKDSIRADLIKLGYKL
jgi:hypothetical protein